MKKSRPSLIPITKNAAAPAILPPGTVGGSPSIGQLQNEAQARLRRINADQCRVAEIMDILVAEVLEREKRLQDNAPKAP